MIRYFVLSLIIIAAHILHAQTNVDRTVQTLDSLGSFILNNWKVSPDLKQKIVPAGDPTSTGFDDSRWDALTLNQSIYPDSCWLRKEITLPKSFLGKSISGQIKLFVSVDDYGYMYINGENKGMFPWDGEFILTPDAKPGQQFVIAIKAINTGGPLRLIRAELSFESSSSLQQTVKDFSLSLRVGQKLLSFDSYQTSSRQIGRA
ncbi:MAG: hypothetical protein EPO24_16225, partial [Bacteroidetes bacterium]